MTASFVWVRLDERWRRSSVSKYLLPWYPMLMKAKKKKLNIENIEKEIFWRSGEEGASSTSSLFTRSPEYFFRSSELLTKFGLDPCSGLRETRTLVCGRMQCQRFQNFRTGVRNIRTGVRHFRTGI